MRTQPRLRGALGRPRSSATLAPRMTDPIALRNRFAMVKGAWDEHLRGRRNWDYPLWAVLMFEAWLGDG